MNSFRYSVVSRALPGDLHTPVSAYLRMRDASSRSILMESSDYHSGRDSRSFIALDPMAEVGVAHGTGFCRFPDGSGVERAVSTTFPTDRLIRTFMDAFDFGHEGASAQLWGFTSFNAVRYFEDIPVKDETREENDAPDLLYILFRFTLEFDHFHNRLTLHELVPEGEQPQAGRIEHLLARPAVHLYDFHPVGEVSSPLTDGQHMENVRRGISHCRRGDVFQVVLSRRFIQRYEGDDFQLYRALRSINPSPYLFYMDFGGYRILGSSPETHCRVEGGRAFIDPIAGTTRRSGDDAADERAADFLRNDPKENAEHVMLVDLARNDLSRNCHGVGVDFYKELQYYSHVIHLVSRVSGTLNPGTDPVKAFIDTFPAGTLSGAPKVRAMQIISELEPHNRGAYGGCVGSISFDGSLNQAITIRSFISRGGELWFQAGGGIVAKSDPAYELQEVNNKLGALRKAIELAAQF
ncbi:MAG: anthranilate synthase component I family protein [Bacteroidales bacterium]|nr:anthranilate synthase component I family protein [Bacteroidales bacterium]MBR5054124.1 anthranilate synthase component I family protein [Bacteroidales bacterium]